MMAEVRKFIEERKQLKDQGFTIFALQEFVYFEELRDQYCDKVKKFEEKLEDKITNTPNKLNNFLKHSCAKKKTFGDSTGWKVIYTAARDGFSGGGLAYLGEVESTEGNIAMRRTFMRVFEQIVSDLKVIPDKTCILLYPHNHRMATNKRPTVPSKVIKRESAAKRKGQTVLQDFFTVIKSPAVASPYKNSEKIPKYQVEKIVRDLRGEQVKILWCPVGHFDLDPSQYVTVHLKNEIALRFESNKDADFRTIFDEALSMLALNIWSDAFQFTEDAISFYLEGGSVAKKEAASSGLTEEKYNAKLAEIEQQYGGNTSTETSDQIHGRYPSTDNETADKENFTDVEVKVEIEEDNSACCSYAQ